MLAGDLDRLRVAVDPQRDPVGDLEARLFAGELDGADDLAGEALAAQLLVDLQLQRHRVARLGLDLVALERPQRHRHVVGAERVVGAVDRDPDLPALRQRLGDVGGVERRHRGGDLRHVLAEARPEGPVVRLHLVGDEVARVGDEVELLHVELGGDQVGERLDPGPLGVGGDDHGAAQRLADLHLGGAAGGVAEADGAAHRRHRRFQVGVAERLVDLGEVAQVDRVGRLAELAAGAALQVAVDLVGEEGGERRQHRHRLDQAGAQGREGGPVALPEALAREPHVPVGELLDEVGDRPPGGGRVEVVHPLAHRRHRRLQPREHPAVEVGLVRAVRFPRYPRNPTTEASAPIPSAFA